jgi:hypothetical protein
VKVLLDENIAHKPRPALASINPATIQYMRFGGLKNGELLNASEAAGFDVLSRAIKHLNTNKT